MGQCGGAKRRERRITSLKPSSSVAPSRRDHVDPLNGLSSDETISPAHCARGVASLVFVCHSSYEATFITME